MDSGPSLYLLIVIAFLLGVALSSRLEKLLNFLKLKLFSKLGVEVEEKEQQLTHDEMIDMLDEKADNFDLADNERELIARVLKICEQKAYALCITRTQMTWLDLEDTLQHNLQIIRDFSDNIIPVGKGSLDEFAGVIYIKDLLNKEIEGGDLDLEALIRKPLFVPRSLECLKVLELFCREGKEDAMVMDEYGGIVGFITLRDILLELLGDNEIENKEDDQITLVSKNLWQVDGLCSIEDFKERFEIDELPLENVDHFQSMGGFLLSQFCYIPKVGEKVEWDKYIFTVHEVTKHRISKIYLEIAGDSEVS